jgi:hypothetical protein
LKDNGRQDYTLNSTTLGPTNGAQFSRLDDGWGEAGQAHQGHIARAASLPDGGIKDSDYGERGGEQSVNQCRNTVIASPLRRPVGRRLDAPPTAHRPPVALFGHKFGPPTQEAHNLGPTAGDVTPRGV